MRFTGERVIPEMQNHDPRDVQAHMARYVWAMHPLCQGKVVLDAACGVGYGTSILSVGAKLAVGIDLDPETVAYARERYGNPSTLFLCWDLHEMSGFPLIPEVVVSFETIEHLQHPEQFLAWLVRTLRPGGRFICSAPENSGSQFHVRDYTKEQLAALLDPYFPQRSYFSQDIGTETWIKTDPSTSNHPTHIFICET